MTHTQMCIYIYIFNIYICIYIKYIYIYNIIYIYIFQDANTIVSGSLETFGAKMSPSPWERYSCVIFDLFLSISMSRCLRRFDFCFRSMVLVHIQWKLLLNDATHIALPRPKNPIGTHWPQPGPFCTWERENASRQEWSKHEKHGMNMYES